LKERKVLVKIGCKIDEVRVDGNLRTLGRDLDHFEEIGLDAVEIPVHGLDVIRNGRLDQPRLQSVQAILNGHPFAYTVHSPNPLNLMDQDQTELHLAVFRSSLEFAGAIGARVVVYHAGRYVAEEAFAVVDHCGVREIDRERLLEQERNILRRLSEEYPEITIGVENARPYRHHSPYCYAESLDRLGEQVRAVERENVRITLDIGHLHMAARFYGFGLVDTVARNRGLFAHTHIHDNFGGAVFHQEKQQTHQIPFGRGDSHMPVGWGAIPLREVLRAYLAGYQQVLMMELRSRYFENTRESRDNLVRLVQSLDGDGVHGGPD
jgi:sugar phosphate isomerase/epimerase